MRRHVKTAQCTGQCADNGWSLYLDQDCSLSHSNFEGIGGMCESGIMEEQAVQQIKNRGKREDSGPS